MDSIKTKNGELASLNLEADYRTGRSDPALSFYNPCLMNSSSYDRAVGYFRSSIYLIVGESTVEFARRGGKIRLICSPMLYEDDSKSIHLGYAERERALAEAISLEIDEMLGTAGTEYRTRVLATLIATGAMDVRLAVRPENKGLYHEKIGIFSDGSGNTVSFIGSANETWNAWHQEGNFESIEVFCSWKDANEQDRVTRHQVDFEKLWAGEMPGLRIAAFPQAINEKLVRHAHKSLDEIDVELLEFRPLRRSPMPHQKSAIEAWKQQGSRGILEHATGSGKTFTAIVAAREHTRSGLPVLVLVPSRLLLEQWAKEIQDEIPDVTLLLAGAGNVLWKQGSRLKGMTSGQALPGSRVVLATMQTAASVVFRAKLSQGSHLMVVADEVHQIGSPFNAQSLEIDTGPRLGLSATPKRYGDPEGTQRLLDYFRGVVPPPVTLQDAIKAGRLVEYKYFPHPVHLTATETQEWKDISERIRLEIARSKTSEDGGKIVSDKAKMMLINRSRISKKASNKINLALKILGSNYADGQRWLVYCEDASQLRQVMDGLVAQGMRPVEYHSAMEGDRKATLDWFKIFGGILVSIKCLDEGVDIPLVDHALILASSQNPRQFIQRRGRVLRQASGKMFAVIHDAIVVPLSLENEPEQFSLLKSELLRSIEFANFSLNRSAGIELNGIAARLGIDPNMLIEEGIEEEE